MFTKYKYDALTVAATNYNTKVSVEIPMDSSLDELFEVFRTISVGLGYQEGSWKDIVMAKAEEYEDEVKYYATKDEPHMRMLDETV